MSMDSETQALFVVAEQNLFARSEIDVADYKQRDKISVTLDKCYAQMKVRGLQNCIQDIRRFAHRENEEVRLWFSAILLQYDEIEARKVLTEIINSDRVIAGYAEIILDNWDSGELKL